MKITLFGSDADRGRVVVDSRGGREEARDQHLTGIASRTRQANSHLFADTGGETIRIRGMGAEITFFRCHTDQGRVVADSRGGREEARDQRLVRHDVFLLLKAG